MNRGSNSGFTMLEVLVASVIIAIGMTASIATIGAMAKNEARQQQTEFLQRLVHEKYDEIVATQDLTQPTLSGDFSDRNLPNYSYTGTLTQTGTINLDSLTVTVTNTSSSNISTSETGLVFIPPASTTPTPTPTQ